MGLKVDSTIESVIAETEELRDAVGIAVTAASICEFDPEGIVVVVDALMARITADESGRRALDDESLSDFAHDLLDAWNIEDTNEPSLTEDFRDRFVARFGDS